MMSVFIRTRPTFRHDRIVPVEGDRHHAGQLSSAVHPQVPAQALLSAQLLQADLLRTREESPAQFTEGNVPVFIPPSSQPDLSSKHGFIHL